MDRFKFLSKSKMKNLPETTGVYCFKQKKNILYIGKAINIKNRVKNHFQQPSYRDKLFIDKVLKAGFFETDSEIEALILEANLIKKYQPKYNVMWRDDKNYFYVAVLKNKQEVPYIFITHQPENQKSKIKNQNDISKLKDIYIGPFTEGDALKKTLRFLRRALPYYTSARHPKNKCAWCHLDLCPGPELFGDPPSPEASAGGSTKSVYGQTKSARQKEYKKNIKKLILILRGEKNAALNLLKKEMEQLAKEKKFEKAGKIRNQIYALQQVMAHCRVIDNEQRTTNNEQGSGKVGVRSGLTPTVAATSDVAEILKKVVGTKKDVRRIECYDVSNMQGKQATGSMIVFTDGKPDKSQYRKFRIKMKNEPNDIAMLKEVINRRLNHPEWRYPDVMLIDGGKAQLNIAIKSKFQNLNSKSNPKIQNIKIISIAKGRQELFIEGKKSPIPLKSLPQKIYNLIIQLDDEAHRFAIAYHKKLRKKNLIG